MTSCGTLGFREHQLRNTAVKEQNRIWEHIRYILMFEFVQSIDIVNKSNISLVTHLLTLWESGKNNTNK